MEVIRSLRWLVFIMFSSVMAGDTEDFESQQYLSERNKQQTIKIRFRKYNRAKDGIDYSDNNVIVAAPAWVEKMLIKTSKSLENTKVKYNYKFNIDSAKKTINGKLSLPQLQTLARNEEMNTSGAIGFDQYENVPKEVVYTLKDLVRQTIIIGKDTHSATGGYPRGKNKKVKHDPRPIYIIDLAGLQLQMKYNSGRLTLISEENNLPKGLLDDEIFEAVVGEKKATYEEVAANYDKDNYKLGDRYEKARFGEKEVFMDTKAYKEFVKKDFILSIIAMNKIAAAKDELINFKFIKYGAGFFSIGINSETDGLLDYLIIVAVKEALKEIAANNKILLGSIARIELPFYKVTRGNNSSMKKELSNIADEIEDTVTTKMTYIDGDGNNKPCTFAAEETDGMTAVPGLITTTTNAADPHAPTGNEMKYHSVDAAFASNLDGKGHKFNPVLNPAMRQEFIKLP